MRQLAKTLGKVCGVLLLSVITLYVALLLINLPDEAPSEAALTLQALQQVQTVNPDDNGYLYFFQHSHAAGLALAEPLSSLMRQCDSSDCNTALMTQPELAQWVAEHQPLLDFYQQLRGFKHWHETIPTDATEALPSYQSLLNGQRLLLLQAWLAAQQQDVATVQLLLQQDLEFWHALLPKHNLLLGKVISGAAIKRHFTFATAIQQQLAPQLHGAMVPASWHTPFSAAELSILQVISGEWVYGNNVVAALFGHAPVDFGRTATEQLELMLVRPFFLMQASSNLHASQLLAQVNGNTLPAFPWYSWLYNPVGKLLYTTTMPTYEGYHIRMLELEPLRQQTLMLLVAVPDNASET